MNKEQNLNEPQNQQLNIAGQDSSPETRLDAKLMATSPLLLDKLEHCVSILNELGERNLIPSDMVENFTNCVLNSENVIDEAVSLHER